jgi:hypothetical protein
MTLMDAPKFDETRYRRNRAILTGAGGLLAVLFAAWWLVAGHPVDWPWNWDAYFFGKHAINDFLTAVEQNDMPKAYGIWMHDGNWQQHPAEYSGYPLSRFEQDWGPDSRDNEYGAIKSHKIAAARVYGNVLLTAILVNGRKTGPLSLTYDPKTHKLDFAPPGEELYLGP